MTLYIFVFRVRYTCVRLGFFIPWVLVKLGLDQAAGSDPIITTIKDITGLLIYFFLINQFISIL